MIRGLIQVHLRGGSVVHVGASVEDEPTLLKLLAELAEDVTRGQVYDDLFQLRPGLSTGGER